MDAFSELAKRAISQTILFGEALEEILLAAKNSIVPLLHGDLMQARESRVVAWVGTRLSRTSGNARMRQDIGGQKSQGFRPSAHRNQAKCRGNNAKRHSEVVA